MFRCHSIPARSRRLSGVVCSPTSCSVLPSASRHLAACCSAAGDHARASTSATSQPSAEVREERRDASCSSARNLRLFSTGEQRLARRLRGCCRHVQVRPVPWPAPPPVLSQHSRKHAPPTGVSGSHPPPIRPPPILAVEARRPRPPRPLNIPLAQQQPRHLSCHRRPPQYHPAHSSSESRPSTMAELRRKLVIVGDGACGKTCLLM